MYSGQNSYSLVFFFFPIYVNCSISSVFKDIISDYSKNLKRADLGLHFSSVHIYLFTIPCIYSEN